MTITKRKGFNFFRSYYDVYNELETDKDKVAFIEALLDRQFLGIKPTNLTGMAKFAYISQTNSIDSQVKGYEDKTKTTLYPAQGGGVGGTDAPCLQVEVKEKEKVKEKNNIPEFSVFLSYAIENEPLICESSLKRKYDAWIVNNWKDGNDRKITNWKTKLLNTLQFINKKETDTNAKPKMVY